MSWNWSLVIGLVVIVLMIAARFWPLIRAARAKRQAARAELIARLTSVGQKTTAPASPTPPTTSASKHWADTWWFTLILVIGGVSGAISLYNGMISPIAKSVFSDGKPAAPSGVSVNGKPAGQTWDPYDHVEYPLVWNEELDGPWCNAMEFPPGTYKVTPTYDAVFLQERGADGGLYDIRITPDGILLGSKWNWRHPFYREFLQQAPLGGNQRVGSFITRVGTGIIVESWKGESFTLTKTERVRPCGINLPPNRTYLNGSRGMVTANIERLRQ